MSQSLTAFSQRSTIDPTTKKRSAALSSQRTLRSVMINQIHFLSHNNSNITDLYLHQSYVYLVKIVGVIESKYSKPHSFTEYTVSDRSGRITCKIWKTTQNEVEEYHNLDKGHKISLIGKIFNEDNVTKLSIHHIQLNDDGISDIHHHEKQLLENEMIFDQLINETKHNEPHIYAKYINELKKEHNQYDSEQIQRRDSIYDPPPTFNLRRRRNDQNEQNNTWNRPQNNSNTRFESNQRRNRERAKSFTPNNGYNNNHNGYNEPVLIQRRERRKSAPFNYNINNNMNANESASRSNIIFGIIDTLFGLTLKDVTIHDIVQKTRFEASRSQICEYLGMLEDDGRIFSTHDDNHWRPVAQ